MVAVVTNTEQGSENTEQGSKNASGGDNEQRDAIGNSNRPEEYTMGAQGMLAEEDDDEQMEEGEEKEKSDESNVQSLKKALSKIIITTPKAHHRKLDFNSMDFPSSYRENTPKEKLVLKYAENFRSQYVHLYRDRKPLLLSPKNECDIEKFVCTTIRPTVLPFPELFEWDAAASFVADYLICEMLDPSFELPDRILSPPTVLKRQKGNCFEYSMLLCSLLLGAGYDAYIVSGYAVQEVCLADEARQICPFLLKKEEESSLASDSCPEENLEDVESSGGTPPLEDFVRDVCYQTLSTGLPFFCGFILHQ